MIDLDAIRARDAEITDPDFWPSAIDRRALLAYVDELLAERALIIQRAENAEAALAYAASTGDECAIEVEALRKDAERYRWLRDRQWPFEFHGNNAEDADVAIDAAMALTKKLARKHTPECSYWDGLMAQVCNCGVDAAMGEKP